MDTQQEIIRISDDFNKIISFEDRFSKFKALGELSKETSSNQVIPKFFKYRILKQIEEHQQNIAGLLETSSLSE